MCRALKILCVAPSVSRLTELKRATVTVHWELVGGATSVEEIAEQVVAWNPDVIVIDRALGSDAQLRARAAKETLRVVSVEAAEPGGYSHDAVREAILGTPQPGGPVRT